MARTSEAIDSAFNRGSDARLAGRPFESPYSSRDEHAMYVHWRLGWIDVDLNWGVEAKGPITPLPRVPCRK